MRAKGQCQIALYAFGVKPQAFYVAYEAPYADALQHSDRDQIAREGQRLAKPCRPVKFPAVIFWPPDFRGKEVVEYHWRIVNDRGGRNACFQCAGIQKRFEV